LPGHRGMNIRQLEAFRAIMVARSTIGAAELLNLSQPAVSRLLSQLEASLKLTLFDRSSGRLVPTPEAMLLYAEVERTFISVDKIREMARDIRSADAGSLNIGAFPLLALGFLPGVIRKFNEIHPRTRITLHVQMSAKVEEWAAAQQIDFGFAEFPYQARAFDRPGFEAEEFCRVPYLLAVPRGHRLAGRKVVRPADLAGERFISLTTNTVGRLLIDQLFEREGVARDMVVDCQVMAVVANLVSQGVGIGFVDPFTAADYFDRNIVPLRFEPAVEMRIGMLHPTHRPLTRIASEFAGLLRSCKRSVLANFPIPKAT
jgi:DNA-binding transcriptional LysR family regulator